jgi:hypothetical protein
MRPVNIAGNFVRVLITKPSGQVVEFARRQTLRQAVADVAGLRHWGIDARVEAPVGVEARR